MANTTPNKESIRRVCILSGATDCYLLVDTGDEYVEILTNIKKENLNHCKQELESWCGMKFRIYSSTVKCKKQLRILKLGEKILPIKFE